MNNKEHQDYIKQLNRITSKLLASKEASQEFYISAGIHNNQGKLNDIYTSEKTIGYSTKKSKK